MKYIFVFCTKATRGFCVKYLKSLTNEGKFRLYSVLIRLLFVCVTSVRLFVGDAAASCSWILADKLQKVFVVYLDQRTFLVCWLWQMSQMSFDLWCDLRRAVVRTGWECYPERIRGTLADD